MAEDGELEAFKGFAEIIGERRKIGEGLDWSCLKPLLVSVAFDCGSFRRIAAIVAERRVIAKVGVGLSRTIGRFADRTRPKRWRVVTRRSRLPESTSSSSSAVMIRRRAAPRSRPPKACQALAAHVRRPTSGFARRLRATSRRRSNRSPPENGSSTSPRSRRGRCRSDHTRAASGRRAGRVTLPTRRLQASSEYSAAGTASDQRLAPLVNDPPLLPVGRADQPVPAAKERGSCFVDGVCRQVESIHSQPCGEVRRWSLTSLAARWFPLRRS